MTVKLQGGGSAAGLQKPVQLRTAARVPAKTEAKPADALVHLTERGIVLSGASHFLWSIWYKLLIHKTY